MSADDRTPDVDVLLDDAGGVFYAMLVGYLATAGAVLAGVLL